MEAMIESLPTNLLAHGAHLVSAPTATGDLLWLSQNIPADALQGPKAIRGGVPIIGPWFAGLTNQNPSHGWARISNWELSNNGAQARLAYDDWGLQVTLTQLENGFALRYEATNRTDHERPIQMAFHPYFSISNIANIAVQELGEVDIYDRENNEHTPHSGELKIAGEFDRIITPAASRAVILDQTAGRRIVIEATGHDSFVVWNPGSVLGEAMPEIGKQWSQFICVEPALLGEDLLGVGIASNQTTILQMRVIAEAL